MSCYTKGHHTIYHHRYHIVWITKYRFRVMHGELRMRIRTIIAQVAEELGVNIVNGVLSADHIYLFVEIPPHVSVSDFVKVAKGRSSRKIQSEFPHIKKHYWGKHFWARGYFSATSGNVIDEVIDNYINQYSEAFKSNNENNLSLD